MTLFKEDFVTVQVNLVFCPVAPRKVVAVQVLWRLTHRWKSDFTAIDKKFSESAILRNRLFSSA